MLLLRHARVEDEEVEAVVARPEGLGQVGHLVLLGLSDGGRASSQSHASIRLKKNRASTCLVELLHEDLVLVALRALEQLLGVGGVFGAGHHEVALLLQLAHELEPDALVGAVGGWVGGWVFEIRKGCLIDFESGPRPAHT